MVRAANPYVWGSPWECDPRVSRVTADLGGVHWAGRPHAGPCFLLQRLDGWWGGGAVSGGAVPFTHSDSGVHGDTYFHGRVITLRGLILSNDGAEQMDDFDRVAAIWSTGRTQVLTVGEPERGIARQLLVSPVRLPEPQPISDLVASVSITVESDKYPLLDTREQSAAITTSGVTLSNKGTADAYPVVSLVGPLTNPAIVWPGGLWQYNLSVPAGTTLTVEMDRKRVRNLATTEHSRNNVSGSHNWLALPPGDTVVTRTGAGSGTITAKWRSAWH